MPSQDSDFQNRLSYFGARPGAALGQWHIARVRTRHRGHATVARALLPGEQAASNLRHSLLACMIGGAPRRFWLGSCISSPTLPSATWRRAFTTLPGDWPRSRSLAFSLLFRCELWKGRDLPFLTLVMLFGLAMVGDRNGHAGRTLCVGGTVAVVAFCAHRAKPSRWRCRAFYLAALPSGGDWRHLLRRYFGYYTYCFYYSLRSGYDLGIYDSLLVEHAARGIVLQDAAVGGARAFALRQSRRIHRLRALAFLCHPPEQWDALALQSAFLGSAAIPLYKLARRHIDRWPACILALTYLLYPALHGENLFEFHFLPFGPFLLWWAWYFLEARRDRWAALFVLFTLSCREDVSSWVAVLGLYFLLTGRRPRAGLVLAVVGTLWCFALKFIAMPYVGGGESFTDIYKDLLPKGAKSFGSVVMTVARQPGIHPVDLGRDEQAHLHAADPRAARLSALPAAHLAGARHPWLLLYCAVDPVRSSRQYQFPVQRPLDRVLSSPAWRWGWNGWEGVPSRTDSRVRACWPSARRWWPWCAWRCP
jgi:hypothetical protein